MTKVEWIIACLICGVPLDFIGPMNTKLHDGFYCQDHQWIEALRVEYWGAPLQMVHLDSL